MTPKVMLRSGRFRVRPTTRPSPRPPPSMKVARTALATVSTSAVRTPARITGTASGSSIRSSTAQPRHAHAARGLGQRPVDAFQADDGVAQHGQRGVGDQCDHRRARTRRRSTDASRTTSPIEGMAWPRLPRPSTTSRPARLRESETAIPSGIAMAIVSAVQISVIMRPSDVKAKISNDLLVKYLLYAKINNTEGIRISSEAMEIYMAFYHEIRTPEKAADITATPRQLEGMLKLGIARCRTMLRNIVSGDDATQTVAALSYAYHGCGMITSTGGMNQTAEYSKPLDKLKPVQAFRLVMLNLTKDNTVPVKKETVILELVEKAKMETSKAYEIFNKEYDNNKLLQNDKREFLLMDKYE